MHRGDKNEPYYYVDENLWCSLKFNTFWPESKDWNQNTRLHDNPFEAVKYCWFFMKENGKYCASAVSVVALNQYLT